MFVKFDCLPPQEWAFVFITQPFNGVSVLSCAFVSLQHLFSPNKRVRQFANKSASTSTADKSLLHRSNRSAELVFFHQVVIHFVVSRLSFGSIFGSVVAEFAQVVFGVAPVG